MQLNSFDGEIPENVIRMDLNYGTTDLKKLSKHYAIQVLEKVGVTSLKLQNFLESQDQNLIP